MNVYYAQIEYRKSHGHWAARLEETNLNSDQLRSIRFIPQLDGWAAETMSGEQVWHVRHDSKLEMVLP